MKIIINNFKYVTISLFFLAILFISNTAIADFQPYQAALPYDVNPTPPYTITPCNNPSNGTISPGTMTVASGGSQNYTITPNSGYVISDVTVDASSQGAINNYTFTNVTADHTICATFNGVVVTNYTITASSGPNGTVTPSGDTVIASGGSQNYTITASGGYYVNDVLVDAVSQGPIS